MEKPLVIGIGEILWDMLPNGRPAYPLTWH